jgi:glycosyltransferase EpsF
MGKVLHLIHGLNRGGIEKWLLSMLGEIPRSKYEMDFCCKGPNLGALDSTAREFGAKVVHCPLGINQLKFAIQLKNILRQGKYDILHNHVQTYSGLAVWVAQQLDIPNITSFHNTSFGPEISLTRLPIVRQIRSAYGFISMKYSLRHSDLITGCSQGVIDCLKHRDTSIRNRSGVIYYGVNFTKVPSLEERSSFRKFFGWSADTPLILNVGRLVEQKNHLGLLSIFQRVVERIPKAKLLIVGDGLQKMIIEKNINQRGLKDSVRLLGVRDDVPSLMSHCDVFLFPSLYEGFGLVAIEASAAKLPIVGSKIPGLTEAVIDGKTGILHNIDDTQGMADSVVKIIQEPQYRDLIGNNGLQWVKENFSTKVSAQNLMETYKYVLNK